VAALIFAEATAIASVGLAAGFLIGITALVALERAPQFHGYIQIQVQPSIVLGIICTALVTAVAGAIYPAQFASKVQPAEALRYE
jgi:putative ABC transport system permease protein